MTDCPIYRLSLNLNGQVKEVEDYVGESVGMPASVTELENAVDLAADSARWVSTSANTISAMLQAGVATDSPQATKILRTAVDLGDLVTVRALLTAGTPFSLSPASPEFKGWAYSTEEIGQDPGASLLEVAVESRNEATRADMLKTLLTFAQVRADSASKQQALARAVKSGLIDLAKILIGAGADPSARFTFAGGFAQHEQDETYLMLAAGSGVWAMLDDALGRPHDIRAVDSDGRTALVYAAVNAGMGEDFSALVDRLFAAGADRSELDEALFKTGEPNSIRDLVSHGGNINARDIKGNTPLFQAITAEEVQAKLDAGADPSLRNFDGKTAVEASLSAPTRQRRLTRRRHPALP